MEFYSSHVFPRLNQMLESLVKSGMLSHLIPHTGAGMYVNQGDGSVPTGVLPNNGIVIARNQVGSVFCSTVVLGHYMQVSVSLWIWMGTASTLDRTLVYSVLARLKVTLTNQVHSGSVVALALRMPLQLLMKECTPVVYLMRMAVMCMSTLEYTGMDSIVSYGVIL